MPIKVSTLAVRATVTIVVVIAALALRVSLTSALGNSLPYVTFFPAVILCAWYGGLWAGLGATLLSASAAAYYVTDPVYNGLASGLFVACGALISISFEALRRDARKAESACHQALNVLEYMADGCISLDERGLISYVNRAADEIAGRARADLLGKSLREAIPAAGPIGGNQRIQMELTGVASNRLIHIDARPWTNGGFVVQLRDVTERRRAERQLDEAERKLGLLLRSNVVGIVVGDLDGIVYEANDEFLRIIGRTADEVTGKRIDWKAITPEEFREADAVSVRQAMTRGTCPAYEKAFIRPDGTRIPVMLGYALSGEGRRDGIAFIVDLSQRKKAEDALRRSNQELQQFAYSASHDLKEPLRMIRSYMHLMKSRYSGRLDKDADEYIDFAVNSSQRMQELVDSLLEYARAGDMRDMPVQVVDANEAVRQALASLQSSIKESGAEITCAALPSLIVNEFHAEQLFQNLIGNAIKYRGENPPKIDISVSDQTGVYVFAVRDNGIGIEPRHFERIFAVFERIHGRTYPGSGIGLATCQRIVARYRGSIWVESQPGIGSTFYFSLPAATNVARQSAVGGA
jgi:PAS domain S-box-containing protein